MTEEKYIFQNYADMYAMLRKCKDEGIEAHWNKEELMAGELIVYVQKDRKENENG